MIDFNSLNIRTDSNYSFVGIQRENGKNNLFLPKGFASNSASYYGFDERRNLFFQLYKVLRVFKRVCIEKGYLEDSKLAASDRDGIAGSEFGSKIEARDDNGTVFYSKLDAIEGFADTYSELKVVALKNRIGKSQKFDISQIHKYLHQAIYLPNNAAYIDEALIAKPIVQLDSTDIVSMYCYLYAEIKEQLNELIGPEVKALAEDFRQHHLGIQDSIFNENTYERTLDALKDLLDTIDKTTAIKDDDYWQYYEAIELFLYGEWSDLQDGRIWGISNFHSVWESMCLTHLVKTNTPQSLLFVDTQYVKDEILSSSGFSNRLIQRNGQIFKINGSQLIPDAVISVSIDSQIKKNSPQRSYHIRSNTGWNDYGFRTSFNFTRSEDFGIGYVGQDYSHTIHELKAVYPNYTGTIDKVLDRKFYSFWYVKPKDTIDAEYLHRMYCFNHLFYVALREGATDWGSFKGKILAPLSIEFGSRHNPPKENVFTHSLLRGYCIEGSEYQLQKDFELTIKKMVGIYNNFLEVVDIKYLTDSYLFDENNAETIKARSVRKQFVYEHLLQKQTKRAGMSKKSIRSSFWLPKSKASGEILMQPGLKFMDGYIQLMNVNFMTLAENYTSP